jgi:putative holliday junction resolvase
MTQTKRILAVDYGKKNIGLAYSDELGITVQPLPSIPNFGLKKFMKHLRDTIEQLHIEKLVLGMPFNMDGTKGESAIAMESLLDTLKAELLLPVCEVDERLSTVEALDFWRNMGLKQQRKYRTVDSLAAAMILERYLGEYQPCENGF